MGSDQLTAAQRAAVEDRGGTLLVSAAAGSGKTKVLVDRLMGYLCDPMNPAELSEFLIITYTKAAAAELREKIATRLAERLAEQPGNRHLQRQVQRQYLAQISTVHSFCADLLRENAFSLELPGDFRVADETECAELRQSAMESALEEAYAGIGENPDLQAFVDTQGFGRDDRTVPEIVAQVYDSARCHLQPEAWLNACLEQADVSAIEDAAQTPWGADLLRRLQDYLDEQVPAMERALEQIELDETLCRQYGPTFQRNLEQMRSLRTCESWNAVHNGRILDFGRLAAVRKPEDPEHCERLKAVRAQCWEGLKALQEPFSATSGQVLVDLQQANQALRGLLELVRQFAARFQREKGRRHVLDFGDLEHRTLDLLLGKRRAGPTNAAREIGRRFREVMVDEYQDTNEVQDQIFAALSSETNRCFLVGDVKQSIYRFRLADPQIFLQKYETFADAGQAEPGEGRRILLSENFRSGGAVLEAANCVFRCTMGRQVGGLDYGEAEALREGVPHVPLPQPAVELHSIQLEQEKGGELQPKYEVEADFVAARIARLLRERTLIRSGGELRPVRPGDIVILLRSPGSCAQFYIDALQARGIAAVSGAAGSILETAEIRLLRGLLQVVDNPLQDIPLEAILASPVFGFSADHLGQIRGASKGGPLFEALERAAESGDQDASAFLETLKQLRRAAQLESLSRLLERAYTQTHLEAIFEAMPGGESRRRNLAFFFQTAVEFEQRGCRDLAQFLQHLDRLQERGLRPEDGPADQEAVQILSIHKSKGLEFPVVVLSNLSAAFNREDLRSNVLIDPELGIGCSVLDRETWVRYPTVAKRAIREKRKAESTSEELRVLYVAMTRAKDMLIMTYASKYLQTEVQRISREMELPRNLSLSRRANSLGHWILMAAVTRAEAQALFLLGGKPPEVQKSQFPWLIQVHKSGSWAEEQPPLLQEKTKETGWELPPVDAVRAILQVCYEHLPACQAPSKLTVTQLKGRALDQEAAEQAAVREPKRRRTWCKPVFVEQPVLAGREVGIATHLAMQFLQYERCGSREGVQAELERLREQSFLTLQQAEAVDREKIAAFFQTELGKQLQDRRRVLREFKFSILEDGQVWDRALDGESILLQGVVDCCLMEDNGMTILDFKTDRIQPGGEHQAAARYAPQVQAYGRAMQRIFKLPVKKLYLYFFATQCLYSVDLEPHVK